MAERYVNIVVNSKKAEKQVRDFAKNLDKTGQSANKMTGRMKGLSAAIIATLVGGAMAKGVAMLVKAQREFDKLNASLVTATGSAEGAKIAFQGIENLAATTPYSVAEVTEAFVKLRNLGLDPSEKAIISYGNTAAAMGKDVMQFIEAVADASTMEFERLKEFGIKAKNEGDTIAFNFQGMTTRVGNNSKEIEEYLMRLGETEFDGAMANRMDTVDGKLSNFADSWEKTVRLINQSGFGDAVKKAVEIAIEALEWINIGLESGSFEMYFKGIMTNFRGFLNDFTAMGNQISKLFNVFSSNIGDSMDDIGKWISGAFINIVPNITAFLKLIRTEVSQAIQQTVADVKWLYTAVTKMSFSEAQKQWVIDSAIIAENRQANIVAIMDEHNLTIKTRDEQIRKARELRAELEEKRAAESGEVLGQFGVKQEAADRVTETPEGQKMMQGMAAETGMIQAELEARQMLWQQYGQHLVNADKDNYGTRLMELDAYFAEQNIRENMAFENELARISQQAIALSENKKISEEERMMGMMELEQQELLAKEYHQQSLTELEAEGMEARMALKMQERDFAISTAQSAFGDLMTLTQGQSKKGFEVAKKGAMAMAAAKGWEAATAAWAAGMSTGGPWAPVVAAGYTAASLLKTGAQIKSLSNTKYGSGSSGGGGGGSGGMPSIGGGASIPSTATQVTEQTQQRRSIEVKIQPGLYSHEQVREIMQVAQGDDETVAGWNQAQQDAQRRGVIASV